MPEEKAKEMPGPEIKIPTPEGPEKIRLHHRERKEKKGETLLTPPGEAVGEKGFASPEDFSEARRGAPPGLYQQLDRLRDAVRRAGTTEQKREILDTRTRDLHRDWGGQPGGAEAISNYGDLLSDEIEGITPPGSPAEATAEVVRRAPGEVVTPERVTEEVITPQVIEELDIDTARTLLRELELGKYASHGLATYPGRDMLDVRIAEIGGQKIRKTETLYQLCREKIQKEGTEEDKRDLRDLQMVGRSLADYYWSVHQAKKTALGGKELRDRISEADLQPYMPDALSLGGDVYLGRREATEWQAWNEYLERDGKGCYATYLDPEWVPFEILGEADRFYEQSLARLQRSGEEVTEGEERSLKRVAENRAWREYEWSLRNRGIEINRRALQRVKRVLFSEELKNKVKLQRILMLREVGNVPLRRRKLNSQGEKTLDIYPCMDINIREVVRRGNSREIETLNQEMEGMVSSTVPELQANTHLWNRTRPIVGLSDAFTYWKMRGQGITGYDYHPAYYAANTRILGQTRNGIRVYDRLYKPNDVRVLDPEKGESLSLPGLTLISGMDLGPGTKPETGDFFAHIESRNMYHPERLRRIGLAETIIPVLARVPGRNEIINNLFEYVSLKKCIPISGDQAPGRGDEAVNLINRRIARENFAALSWQRIGEAIGIPGLSWRAVLQGTQRLMPEDVASTYLFYLNQPRTERVGDLELEVVDKELINALLELPPEFEEEYEIVDEYGETMKDRLGRPLYVDERKLLLKLAEQAARGIEWNWEDPDDIVKKLEKVLTPLEQRYFLQSPTETPFRMRDKMKARLLYSLLNKDQRFELVYALANKRSETEVVLYDRERDRHFTVNPEAVDQAVEENRQFRIILERLEGLKPGRTKEIAQRFGEVERAMELASIIRAVTMEKIRSLVKKIQREEELKRDDSLIASLVPSQREFKEFEDNFKEAQRENKPLPDKDQYFRKLGKISDDNLATLVADLKNADLRKKIMAGELMEEKIKGVDPNDPLFEGLSEDEKRLLFRKMKNTEVMTLILGGQEITKETGLTEDEREYLRRKKREKFKYVSETKFIEKLRANRRRSQPDLYQDETIRYSQQERDFWSQYENRVRIEAINAREANRARLEVNRIKLKQEKREALKNWEKTLLDQWNATGGREVYYTVDMESLSEVEKEGFDIIKELFTHYNWSVTRRVFNLDYPWLDLEQRQFLSYVIDWAIARKIGLFGREDPKTGEIIDFPFEKRGGWFRRGRGTQPDIICEAILEEKRKMRFRYGPGEGISVIPDWSDISDNRNGRAWNGEIYGDPAMFWEVGDNSYDPVAWMAHRRWDAPDTLASHNIFMQIFYKRVYTSRRFIRAVGRFLPDMDVMRLVLSPWDLFKDPTTEPRCFLSWLVTAAKDEEGLYYKLEKSRLLSGWMARFLRIAEGERTVTPERMREWMARIGLKDSKTGRVGGEEYVQGMIGGVGRVIQEVKGFVDAVAKEFPWITLEAPAVAGLGGLVSGYINNFLTFGRLGIAGSGLSWLIYGAGFSVLYLFLRPLVIKTMATFDLPIIGRVYDCIHDPEKVSEEMTESIRKRRLIPE